MAISDLPILTMLRTRMEWHQERQRLLAENVANADTPNFRPSDLTPPRFDVASSSLPPVRLVRTDPGHLPGVGLASAPFSAQRQQYQIRPAGNAVNLEDEMLKVAANQMDYQAVTQLYARSLGLIKTALGRK